MVMPIISYTFYFYILNTSVKYLLSHPIYINFEVVYAIIDDAFLIFHYYSFGSAVNIWFTTESVLIFQEADRRIVSDLNGQYFQEELFINYWGEL